MWPYSEAESRWLAMSAAEPVVPAAIILTPELVEYYIRRGRRLRAAAAARLFAQAAAGMKRLFRRRAPWAPKDLPTLILDGVRVPLNAMRTSAQALRDDPDLSPEQRAKCLDALVAESERLDRLMRDILTTSAFKPGKGQWQIDAVRLEKRLARPAA